jgi:hypothetical protein
MAIVNIKSTAVGNADASPRIFNQPHLTANYLRQAVGVAAVAASDSVNSVYRLARLRSSDRVSGIGVSNTALGGSAAGKIGLLRTASDGGAAVSDALFATGLSLVAASASFTNQAFQNSAIANAEKRLWELLGLSADPGLDYDLALTLTAVAASAGTLAAHISYVSGT